MQRLYKSINVTQSFLATSQFILNVVHLSKSGSCKHSDPVLSRADWFAGLRFTCLEPTMSQSPS